MPLPSRRIARTLLFAAQALEPRTLLSAPGPAWQPVFVDEFNGPSLDTTKWSLYLPWSNSSTGDNRYHNSNYLSYMMPDDVKLTGNGALELSTQKRNVSSANGTPFQYTQGMITTSGKFSIAYGYVEIRAKLPTGPGNWPAFWTLNGWPPEDDIMEAWTTARRNHQGLYGMDNAWHDANHPTFPSDNWHTYAMEWGPGYQKFFIDGVQTLSISGSFVPGSNKPQYLLLNSGVAANQVANYSNANNNTLQVDYVRVWSYSPTTGPSLPNPSLEGSGAFTSPYGGASIGNFSPRTGDKSLRLSGTNSGSEYTIAGLSPNTTYTFAAYGYAERDNAAMIGVKSHGGIQLQTPVTTSQYTQKSVTFTTGPSNTSATLFLYKNAGSSYAYFDDLSFTPTPTLAAIPDQSMPAGDTINIPITVANVGPSRDAWSLTAASTNPSLIPAANVKLVWNGNAPQLQIQSLPGQNGPADITVTLTDPFVGPTASRTFRVNVTGASATLTGDQQFPGQSDTIRLTLNGAYREVYLNNAPTPAYRELADAVQSMTLLALAGDDSITIDFTHGNPIPTSGLTIDAGAQSRTDTVSFLFASDPVTLAPSQLTVAGRTVSFSGAERLLFTFTADAPASILPGTNTPTSIAVQPGATLTLSGGANLPANTDLTVEGALLAPAQSLSFNTLQGSGTLEAAGSVLNIGAANGSSIFPGTIAGSPSLTKSGAGLLSLTGAATTAALAITGGRLQINTASTLLATSLSISPGALLDLSAGALAIDYAPAPSPADQVRAWLATGYAAGRWNGPTLASTAAAADPEKLHAVGLTDDGARLRLAYAPYGDANLDGNLSADDVSLLLLSLASNLPASWQTGDFNLDARTSPDDLSLLSRSLAFLRTPTSSHPSASALVAKPEASVAVPSITDDFFSAEAIT